MAYIDELLGRGERILFVGRQHTFVLISNILAELSLIVILVAAGVAAQTAFDRTAGAPFIGGVPAGQVVLLVCGVISLLILLSAVLDYFRWSNTEYVVTDRRVIQLRGIFNKAVSDSSLEKINDLELRQSWIGRIFDFGDIEILTASDVGVNVMRKIAHPLEFKRAMLEAKQEQSHGYSYLDQQAAAYAQPPDYSAHQNIEQMLQTLADLRDQGILSEEEFEAKKRALLSRI